MILYQITNWSTVYESHESRKLDSLRYVYVPNKHDGLGFRRMAAQKNACELFAAWTLLLQIASKGKKGQRGVLARDGVPLDAEECALMTGFPADAFKRAFNFFSLPIIGWLTATSLTDTGENLPGLIGEIPSSPGNLPLVPGQPGTNPGRPGNAPGNLPLDPQQREEKEEKEREEKEIKGAVAPVAVVAEFPHFLQTDAFRSAWADWLAYRAERRLAKYKPRTEAAQLAKLAEWGHDVAIAAIRESIRQQWQGLFLPKGGQQPREKSAYSGAF